MDDDNNLESKLESLMAQLTDITSKLEPLEHAKAQLQVERDKYRTEYEAKMAEYAKQDRELHDAMWEARVAVRKIKSEVDSTTRQIEQVAKVKEAQEKFEALSGRWDVLTIGAPWREWAKDHQLEAGKRMAYQQKFILADGMGLGKTLSSIIAIDLIEQATKDATPTNPVIFDVEKA